MGQEPDYKQRVRAALERHHARELKKNQLHKKRKNNAPEKEVQKECMDWMRARNWSVQIIESKATFDPRRGVWRQQAAKAGTCDCMGSTDEGLMVAVEFKAPGRLKTFNGERNKRQIDFIYEKIKSGAFACVTDSAKRLEEIYEEFMTLRLKNIELAKKFLFKSLP